MKILSLAFASLFLLGSCQKIDQLTQFDLSFDETAVIPSLIGLNLPLNIPTPNISTNAESTLEMNNTHKDMVESVRLKTLQLTLTNPVNGDFNFLKSIQIYMSADGLDEILVASLTDIPSNVGNTLTLTPIDVELMEYVLLDQVDLRVKTVTDELITTAHQINIHSVFRVDAKILGL